MLKVKNISFEYQESQEVLKNISFQLDKGEHLSIVGKSGSGKTTMLNLLYGVYDLTDGEIVWNETKILGPKFNLVVGFDFMKYVSQEFNLVPYFTVEETIGKHLSNFYLKDKANRVKELLNLVNLDGYSKTPVKLLSGGQKQRVSIARALAKQPEIILLDEPFSHIDSFQKQTLRPKLFHFLKENNITCIVATHDKEDVLHYADKMAVLSDKKIAELDSPQNLYYNPKNTLTASFFDYYNIINNSIVYAHNIKVVVKSDIKASVVKSLFNGHNYLVSAKHQKQNLLFYSDVAFQKGESIYLEVEDISS